ncbi:MAG: hypothetical protein ABSH48_26380 [Verrucomicrobiota bacterium]|jgi:hypothetical protein
MSILNLTSTQLRQAADLKEKIASLETQLAGIIFVGGKPHIPSIVPELANLPKRQMSPAHKAKIKAAQKLRWAKVNAAKARPVAALKPEKKAGRKMSAAGRAAISAAAKARWAKVRAAKREG